MKELNEKNIKKFIKSEWGNKVFYYGKFDNNQYEINLTTNLDLHEDMLSRLEEEFGPLNYIIHPRLGFDISIRENPNAAKVENVKPLNEKNLRKYVDVNIGSNTFVGRHDSIDTEYRIRAGGSILRETFFLDLKKEFGPLNWAIQTIFSLYIGFDKKQSTEET